MLPFEGIEWGRKGNKEKALLGTIATALDYNNNFQGYCNRRKVDRIQLITWAYGAVFFLFVFHVLSLKIRVLFTGVARHSLPFVKDPVGDASPWEQFFIQIYSGML